MGSGLITAARITDYAIAHATNSILWDSISEDDTPDHIPNVQGEYWIGIYEGGRYAGCVRVVQSTSCLFECHLGVLRGFKRITEYCLAAYQWMLDNIPHLSTLYCRIPRYKTGVQSLVSKIGFTSCGCIPAAFTKNGTTHDLLQLAISRDCMEALCRKQFQS